MHKGFKSKNFFAYSLQNEGKKNHIVIQYFGQILNYDAQ